MSSTHLLMPPHIAPRRFRYLAAALTLAACSPTDPTAPVPKLLSLAAAESAWRDAGIRNYSFVGTVSCFCPDDYSGPKRVTVRNGLVTLVTDPRDDRVYPASWRHPVDSLFNLIRREATTHPARLDVTYDRRLGYPRRISYGPQELDGGGVITIESLRADP